MCWICTFCKLAQQSWYQLQPMVHQAKQLRKLSRAFMDSPLLLAVCCRAIAVPKGGYFCKVVQLPRKTKLHPASTEQSKHLGHWKDQAPRQECSTSNERPGRINNLIPTRC